MSRMRRMSRHRVLTCLLLISASSCLFRPWPRRADGLREGLAPVLAPLSHALMAGAQALRRSAADWRDGRMDEQQARHLLVTHEALGRQLTTYVEQDLLARDQALRRQAVSCEQEILRLQRQLNEAAGWAQVLRAEFPCRLVPARVIAAEPVPYGRARALRAPRGSSPGDHVTTRTLLTGRSTALPEPMAALSASALAGRITSSGAWTAHLQLVTDPGYTINGYVLRDPGRPRVIEDMGTTSGEARRRPLEAGDPPVMVTLTGCGDGMVSKPVPAGHAVAPGDTVITTGDDGRLPMRIVIGAVRQVEHVPDNHQFVTLDVAPEAPLSALEHVYIVWPGGREASP